MRTGKEKAKPPPAEKYFSMKMDDIPTTKKFYFGDFFQTQN